MLSKIEGIVIRTQDYGESNKVVILFTRDRGKLAAMARGAKKPKSRVGAATQPFTLGQYLCFAGNGMATISQADILQSHYPLRADLFLTAYTAYMTELLDRLTEDKEPHPFLYELLATTLSHLEEGTDPDILSRIFELKVLEAVGYRPRLDGCAVCGKVEGPMKFSVSQGGLICLEDARHDSQALPLSPPAARILKLLQRVTPDRLGQVQVKEETKNQMERVIRSFMDEYVDLRFKSRPFLDRLRKEDP
ncbi:DNA repair protein RecO [Paludifilum halophilum]|uniref:DNA repair protein RecO n=1 Tax=Paludifilum halophilum TaxID=1642702 RepID=A0A235B723_9BACL|nr:DNA repair protein RecO [Paludifilum halophilum]OYD07677.1 DNA repair protein RecO [Paludifilum halophilum]